MFWAKYHLEHLRNWRKAAEAVAKAVEDLKLNAEVYVVGGAAEGRLTILSDIDILVCVKEETEDLGKLRKQILTKAMDKYGLPWDYPVEIHISPAKECAETLNTLKSLKVK